MAIKTIPVPFCDQCDEPWLPKHLLADGTPNPIFEHPEDSKRCGKCKSTRWNAGGVDRRRKAVAQDSDAVVVVPSPSFTKEEWTKLAQDTEKRAEEKESFAKYRDAFVSAAAAENAEKGRCRHGLYSCRECHPQEAH